MHDNVIKEKLKIKSYYQIIIKLIYLNGWFISTNMIDMIHNRN
jgi:hypothetical protein